MKLSDLVRFLHNFDWFENLFQVLLDMCKKGIVFTKEEIPKLSEKDSFLTQTVSQVIENQPRKFMEIQNILVSIGLTSKSMKRNSRF